VIKLEHEKVNFGGLWHSDTAYLDKPPMATMLIARETPPRGGDTLFANMYLAYETLSDGLRGVLDGLTAVNSSAKADTTRTREDRVRDSGKTDAKKQYDAEHPVVRTHPETGRKALYVNAFFTSELPWLPGAEGRELLELLCRQASVPEYQCRFRWRPDSLAFWDNRAVQHYAASDYWPERRVMERVTIIGDRPV
jgi:taurine dioxygenase